MGKALVVCACAIALVGGIEATFDNRVSGRTVQQQCPEQVELTITPIDYPNASATVASGINNLGHVVGSYVDRAGTHGFLLVGTTYTPINFPGSTYTTARSINNNGHIVGDFQDESRRFYGYVLVDGDYQRINIPSEFPGFFSQSSAQGINDRGEIVGNYLDRFEIIHGFLWVNGLKAIIDHPEGVPRTIADAGGNPPRGINDLGQIVGDFKDAAGLVHGYIRSNGNFTKLEVPCAPGSSITGINDSRQFVGTFGVSGTAAQFPYLFDGRTFIQINVPGATATLPIGINDLGQIVGGYIQRGVDRGFVGSI
jgi:uncharacterized membrane protein